MYHVRALAASAYALALLSGCGTYPEPRPADFARIHPGMSHEEARVVLGTPLETMRFPLSRTESWDYRLLDTWGYTAMYSVIFGADGLVVGVVTQRLNDGGDHN